MTKLWETLASLSILYGKEVFDMADSDKRKLETIERQVGKWDRGTGCEAIYGYLGWIRITEEVGICRQGSIP